MQKKRYFVVLSIPEQEVLDTFKVWAYGPIDAEGRAQSIQKFYRKVEGNLISLQMQ